MLINNKLFLIYKIAFSFKGILTLLCKTMDFEDIIKLEEQSPIYSTGNNSSNINKCVVSFYDNDSQVQIKRTQPQKNDFTASDEIIDYIQNYVDILDSPLQTILNYIDRLDYGQNVDRNILKKRIIKRKNILKRYRAKNRIYMANPYSSPFLQLIDNSLIQEDQAQLKKKRNRVSAQVSRDRKKQYFKELQQKNQKLQDQIHKAKIQNQRLKKQMEQNQKKPKSKFFADSLNNKLTKLLIFLGIICLIGILKNTFTSGDGLSKFKLGSKNSPLDMQKEMFSISEQSKLIEQGEIKVAQFLRQTAQEQGQSFIKPKQGVLTSVINSASRGLVDFMVPQRVYQKLSEIKRTL